jgi:hypothetical protein
MPVQAASLEILEKANVPAPQARAIVQAIEIEIADAKETLATKQDILILRHEMAEMRAELRHELKTEIATLRGDLRSEMLAAYGWRVEGAGESLPPAGDECRAARRGHLRNEHRCGRVGAGERCEIAPHSRGKSREKRGSEGGGLELPRPLDPRFEHIGEELAEPVVRRHAAVDANRIGAVGSVAPHGLREVERLVRNRLERRAGEMVP